VKHNSSSRSGGTEKAAEIIVIFSGLVHAWLVGDDDGVEARQSHLRERGFEVEVLRDAPPASGEVGGGASRP
jgi:hypothetical protein